MVEEFERINIRVEEEQAWSEMARMAVMWFGMLHPSITRWVDQKGVVSRSRAGPWKKRGPRTSGTGTYFLRSTVWEHL